jgi:hypothetical protein
MVYGTRPTCTVTRAGEIDSSVIASQIDASGRNLEINQLLHWRKPWGLVTNKGYILLQAPRARRRAGNCNGLRSRMKQSRSHLAKSIDSVPTVCWLLGVEKVPRIELDERYRKQRSATFNESCRRMPSPQLPGRCRLPRVLSKRSRNSPVPRA